MRKLLALLCIVASTAAFGQFQVFPVKDSVVLISKDKYKRADTMHITIINNNSQEILLLEPMQPLQIFKWNRKKGWQQVSMIGYCSCGMSQCPPPQEYMTLTPKFPLTFDWDMTTSRCLNVEKGEKEIKKVECGKYKVIFTLALGTTPYSQKAQVEKIFYVRK